MDTNKFPLVKAYPELDEGGVRGILPLENLLYTHFGIRDNIRKDQTTA